MYLHKDLDGYHLLAEDGETLIPFDDANGALDSGHALRNPGMFHELRRDGELVERVDEVFFDTLGETLERLIDDGSWRRIRVQCLSCRKAIRH